MISGMIDEGLQKLFVGMRVSGSKEHLRWLTEIKTLEVSKRDEVKSTTRIGTKTRGQALK